MKQVRQHCLSDSIFKCSRLLFQWKYTVRFVYCCLDSIVNRPFYSSLAIFVVGMPLRRSAAPSSYPSHPMVDKRLWLVVGRTGQKSFCMGGQPDIICRANKTWACEIHLFIMFYLTPKCGTCRPIPIHYVPNECIVDPVVLSLFGHLLLWLGGFLQRSSHMKKPLVRLCVKGAMTCHQVRCD